MKEKIWKWVNHIVTGLLIVVFVTVALLVFLNKLSGGEPTIFGYQLKTVLSGSMEPSIKTGSVIAVKPGGDMTRFKENDVITFIDEGERVVTHRIIEVVESGSGILYRTKGDKNDGPDMNPVIPENVLAEYTGFTVPYVGYISEFAQSKNGILALVILPGFLILLYAGYSIWQAIVQLERKYNETSTEEKVEPPVTK